MRQCCFGQRKRQVVFFACTRSDEASCDACLCACASTRAYVVTFSAYEHVCRFYLVVDIISPIIIISCRSFAVLC